MNMRETIKEKTLRLIGLILITIPLMACYPILLYLGLSIKITTIVTVCVSIIAYIMLVTRIEPFLSRVLPFLAPKIQTKFTSAKFKFDDVGLRMAQGPSSYPGVSELDTLFQSNIVRNSRGNWVHS